MEEEVCDKLKLDPNTVTHDEKGVFQAKPQHKMEVLHARETTGDRPRNMVTGKTGPAGEVWKEATGESVRKSQCAVRNCTKNDPQGARHSAEVAAHVYSTTQGSDDPVKSAMLIPTCNASNNRFATEKIKSCYPKKGEDGHPLELHEDAKCLPIEISDKTEKKMNKAGKGTGKGGSIVRGGASGGKQAQGGLLAGKQAQGGLLAGKQAQGGLLAGKQAQGGLLAGKQARGGVVAGKEARGGVVAGRQKQGGVVAGKEARGGVVAGRQKQGGVPAGRQKQGGGGPRRNQAGKFKKARPRLRK